MNKILVIGSVNIDFVFTTDRMPFQGETISGNDFNIFDGGKGANQAIAASRYGAIVDFVGAVGEDEFANRSLNNLEKNGVNTKRVIKLKQSHTGVANILINNSDNRIIIVEGANLMINDDYFDFDQLISQEYNYVLIQSEIPCESIKKIIDICNQKEVKVVYNPAPFKDIGNHFLQLDYMTPNETEFAELCKIQCIDSLLAAGVTIIKTCGADGVEVINQDKIIKIPAPKVEVVDTTGAGDTFNGVLTACLANFDNIEEAATIAVNCASYSTTKLGAQSAMPVRGGIC